MTATAIAKALGVIGDPSAVPALANMLTWGFDEVDLAAIAALQAIGGVEAVGPLRMYAENRSASKQLRDAAKSAIVAVQESLGDVEPGGLALTEDTEAGTLSVVGEAGELSLEEEEA